MTRPSRSGAFLPQAARHFLILGFKVQAPERAAVGEFRSCFVVEVEGNWVLITAGHVIEGLCKYLDAGYSLSSFELHDKLTGHNFPHGVIFPFDPRECGWIKQDWGDFAAWLLEPLTIAALKAGGVQPIAQQAWGDDPIDGYDHLLLIGVPAEACRHVAGKHFQVKATLIPLKLCTTPTSTVEPLHPNMRAARMIQRSDGLAVGDLDGMSGGPIFGVRDTDKGSVYFVAGIQSGWLPESRIVLFFPIRGYLHFVQNAVIELQARQAAVSDQPSHLDLGPGSAITPMKYELRRRQCTRRD